VDPASLIGIVLALVALLATMIMEGSSPMAIILLPPLILVFGGTFGAAIAGSAMADVKKIGGWFKQALLPAKVPPIADRIQTLVSLAEKARKEGLLALEAQVKDIEDPFLKRGLQMGIDGTDPEELRAVLEGEITAKKSEDKVAAKFFTAMGGYAPTIGIIGTVIGLVQVLQSLEDPAVLGPLVASAFVATLWGVLSANVLWLPMSTKITRNSDLRTAQMNLLLAGVTEIFQGTNPRALRVRLQSMLPPSEARQIAA
jgi:chemotaxis protein MotA